jgi:hypothetical protein
VTRQHQRKNPKSQAPNLFFQYNWIKDVRFIAVWGGIEPIAVRLRKFVAIYGVLKSCDLIDGKSQIPNFK